MKITSHLQPLWPSTFEGDAGLDTSHRTPDELALLPSEGVAAFVARFAASHGVAYRRTALDVWAETVTQLSGDDVRTDATCDLLVALKRRGLLSGAQMARLLVLHLRERRAQGGAPS